MLFPVISYIQADNNDKQRSLIRKSSLNTVFSTDYRGVTRIGLICPLYCVCCRNIDLARLCIMFFFQFLPQTELVVPKLEDIIKHSFWGVVALKLEKWALWLLCCLLSPQTGRIHLGGSKIKMLKASFQCLTVFLTVWISIDSQGLIASPSREKVHSQTSCTWSPCWAKCKTLSEREVWRGCWLRNMNTFFVESEIIWTAIKSTLFRWSVCGCVGRVGCVPNTFTVLGYLL